MGVVSARASTTFRAAARKDLDVVSACLTANAPLKLGK